MPNKSLCFALHGDFPHDCGTLVARFPKDRANFFLPGLGKAVSLRPILIGIGPPGLTPGGVFQRVVYNSEKLEIPYCQPRGAVKLMMAHVGNKTIRSHRNTMM